MFGDSISSGIAFQDASVAPRKRIQQLNTTSNPATTHKPYLSSPEKLSPEKLSPEIISLLEFRGITFGGITCRRIHAWG